MTSSVVASALGQNLPESSPIDAWLSITGRSEFHGNAATYRGDVLENVTLDEGAKHIGENIRWVNPPFMQRDDMPWAGDSADAVYVDDFDDPVALGEAKTVALGSSLKFGEAGTDQVPIKVAIQCHWHMIHHPWAPYVLVPVLVGGFAFEFRMYRVERDAERQGLLIQDAEKWHRDYVVTDTCPPATFIDSEYLKLLHPVDNGTLLPATDETDKLCADIIEAKRVSKEAEQHEAQLCTRLKELLGDNAGIMNGSHAVSYKTNKDRETVQWQKLAMKLGATPDMIQQMTVKTTGNRPLNVKLWPKSHR